MMEGQFIASSMYPVNSENGFGQFSSGIQDVRSLTDSQADDSYLSRIGGNMEVSAGEETEKDLKYCVICKEQASGVFFGATVCLPCKSFFIRCTRDGEPEFACQFKGNCDISLSNRSSCQACRYQKCLSVQMRRRERPEQVEPLAGQELCYVCSDIANGIHFGVSTCEGCKKFFRRGLKESGSYVCRGNKMCAVNPRNRNACRYCRFKKCLLVGMSRDAIRMGRPKKDTMQQNPEIVEDFRNIQSLQHHSTKKYSPPANLKPDKDTTNKLIGQPLKYLSHMTPLSWNKNGSVPPAVYQTRKNEEAPLDMRICSNPPKEVLQIKFENKEENTYFRNRNVCDDMKQTNRESVLPIQENCSVEDAAKQMCQVPSLTHMKREYSMMSCCNGYISNGNEELHMKGTTEHQKLSKPTVPWVNNVGVAETNSIFQALLQAQPNHFGSVAEMLYGEGFDHCESPQMLVRREEYILKKYPICKHISDINKFWQILPFDLNQGDVLNTTDLQHINNLCRALKDIIDPMDVSWLSEQTIKDFRTTSWDHIQEHASPMPHCISSVVLPIIAGASQAFVRFALNIPGFSSVDIKDQTVMCKSPIVAQIMGSSVLSFDKEKQTVKNFWTLEVPCCAPIYELRKCMVKQCNHIGNMNLSLQEVAIFVAMMTVSTAGNMELGETEKIHDIWNNLARLLFLYTKELHGPNSRRMEELCELGPRLQIIGQWYRNLLLHIHFTSQEATDAVADMMEQILI